MAASEVFTSAGTIISICASLPATNDSAGYAALSWTEIGEATDLGEFGREYNKVVHTPLKTRAAVKRKGSYDDGAVTLQYAIDDDDAGQVLLDTAVDDDDNYAFKVAYQNGAIDYMQAQVMSNKTKVGSNDNIVGGTAVLEIDSEQGIVSVAS